ncbi:hypothetical protein LZ31DRAFT_345467 [Colletotrichum somersetense]|nr:hypothetical protein LZ31DRAFT_345467 [Colletotrichum somersetense]
MQLCVVLRWRVIPVYSFVFFFLFFQSPRFGYDGWAVADSSKLTSAESEKERERERDGCREKRVQNNEGMDVLSWSEKQERTMVGRGRGCGREGRGMEG